MGGICRGPGRRRPGGAHGRPRAVHFPRPPAEGRAAGAAPRIIAALMPAAGREGGGREDAGRGEVEGGRGVSGRARHPSAPRGGRHPPPESGPGASPVAVVPLAAAAQPGAGGRSPVLAMSVALSNRFQGRRRALPAPSRAPAPPPARGPPPATCARGAGRAGPGETHASRAASLSPAGGKAFGLLKARQERRLAEINRVSARRRAGLRVSPECPPPPRPGSRLRPRGCARRDITPVSSALGLPQFLPSAPAPVPLPPGRSPLLSLLLPTGLPRLGLQVVTLRGGRARPGAPGPPGPGLPGSPPGASCKDWAQGGTPSTCPSSERRGDCPEMAQQVQSPAPASNRCEIQGSTLQAGAPFPPPRKCPPLPHPTALSHSDL